MKGKRRRSRNRPSKQPRAAQVIGFTEAEEAFFRAGTTEPEPSPTESFDDLDEGYRPIGWLRRLFSFSPSGSVPA